jgi:hypothetical protein
MNIDTGLAVVIVAVLIFYLRLIGLQRERVKRLSAAQQGSEKKKKKPASQDERLLPRYSILSPRRRDRVIAGAGVVAILVGVLLYLSILPLPAVQPYWWIPTSIGIVAFSWAFQV